MTTLGKPVKAASSGGDGEHASYTSAATPELVRAAIAAQRFFIDGQTKQEIGRGLGISRFKVARLLDVARDNGLVHIEVRGPLGINIDLGQKLQKAFGLTEAWVVDVADASSDELRAQLGQAAALLLADDVDEKAVVGVSWGRTVRALADALPSLPACTVVQIAGGLPGESVDGASALVRRLHMHCGGALHLLHAPLFVADPATAQQFRGEPSIASTVRMYTDLSTVIVGLGSWDRQESSVASALCPEDLAHLDAAGAVAEICGLFVTAAGELVGDRLNARTVGIRAEELRAVPNVIAVAGGREKVDAVAAVLRAGLCSKLVTDQQVAEAVLAR